MLFFRKKKLEAVEEMPQVKTLKDYSSSERYNSNIFSKLITFVKGIFN